LASCGLLVSAIWVRPQPKDVHEAEMLRRTLIHLREYFRNA
jgi:hypothetical protein